MSTPEAAPVEPFVFGFEFDETGAGRSLTWDELQAGPAAPGRLRWAHLNRRAPGVEAWLTGPAGLDEIAVDALLQEDTRPRATRHENGLLINLRGVNLNPGVQPDDMLAARMWMTTSLVITLRALPMMALQDLRREIEGGARFADSGALVVAIAAGLTDRLEPVAAELDDRADDFEERLLATGETPQKVALSDFRRSTVRLRRYIAPQREALSQLARDNSGLFSPGQSLILRETADRVTRIAEDLDAIRDRGGVLQEQIVEQRGEAMNQRLFVLAIISAVFLPLSFLTGLLGINVGGLPGANVDAAFLIVCLILSALTIAMLFAFKRMRWF